MPKLTTDNLKSWISRLPTEAFPLTFRDSFDTARRMKVRYVWIDCLCIIQQGDRGADWTAEATKMDMVYRNSFCNVSANWSSDSSRLYSSRDPQHVSMPELDLYVEPGIPSIVGTAMRRLFATKSPYLLLNQYRWEQEVGLSPLNQRGWVVQERILSPRQLHFCRDEVFWECRELTASESIPRNHERVPMRCDYVKRFEASADGRRRMELHGGLPYSDKYYDCWDSIVSNYSRTKLTYGSDKLVAISGIARFLKPLLQDDIYVAGLWLKYLGQSMSWTAYSSSVGSLRSPAAQSGRPPLTHRAPSFSWASIDYEVNGGDLFTRGLLPKLRCIEYRSTTSTSAAEQERDIAEDIFGPISSPAVEVKAEGTLRLVRLKDIGDYVFHAFPCSLLDIPALDPVLRDVSHTARVDLDFPVSDAEIPCMERRIFYAMDWIKGQYAWEFLLFELADIQMARYRRIGHLVLFNDSDALEGYLTSPVDEADFECLRYDDATERHTIYIV